MKRLAVVLASAIALSMVAGCETGGQRGNLCANGSECEGGLVCVTQVWNCPGEECWGTCEQECIDAAECEGGDQCVQVAGGYTVCSSADFEHPIAE